MAVSIHPAPPADRLAPPRGLAGPLPVRRPQLAPLVPKKEKRESWGKRMWLHTNTELNPHDFLNKEWARGALNPARINLKAWTDLLIGRVQDLH